MKYGGVGTVVVVEGFQKIKKMLSNQTARSGPQVLGSWDSQQMYSKQGTVEDRYSGQGVPEAKCVSSTWFIPVSSPQAPHD